MNDNTAQKIDRQTAINIRRAIDDMAKHPEYFSAWCDSLFRHVIRERCRLRGNRKVAEDLYRAADATVADLPFEPVTLQTCSKKKQPTPFFKDPVLYATCTVFFLGFILGGVFL